jgi:pSer/pThr/pTyr-binding forkhead associated (FHA) protein
VLFTGFIAGKCFLKLYQAVPGIVFGHDVTCSKNMPENKLGVKYIGIKTYFLYENGEIRIGRLVENDIIIDNTSVSGRHACVTHDGFGFMIKDLDSRNGTFVGRRPVKTRRLVNGDLITIGKHELLFTDEVTAKVDEKKDAEHVVSVEDPERQTSFLDTRKQQEILQDMDRYSQGKPLVTIKYKDKVLYKHLLKVTETQIGRDSSNKIVIEDIAISSQHALITRTEDGYIIQDCKSRNGTFVNNMQVSSHKLLSGDVITIGRHELIFEEQGVCTLEETFQPITKTTASPMFSYGTSFIDTKKQREMSGKEPNAPLAPVLSYTDGVEKEFVIQKKVVTIGKGKESDVIVKGFLVGNTAALLTSRPDDGYYLTCNEGMIKPIVNGKKLKDSVKLQDSDVIQIGSTILKFKKPAS